MEEKFLIEGLASQNKIVFDFIFQYYYSGLCTFSMNYVGNAQIAEDIVQDFFVSLWFNFKNITIRSSLKSYLFASIKNRSLDYLKHQKVEMDFRQKIFSKGPGPEEQEFSQYSEFELREAIQSGLEKLPNRCREIFVLSRFEGMQNDEIASKFNISKRTVELQISNALKILRHELQPFLPAILITWILR